MNTHGKIEFGDFQTPLAFASDICALLRRQGVDPDAVMEPTCGVGAFLHAAAIAFPKAQLFGWDINSSYVEQTRAALSQAGAGARSLIAVQDFFDHGWTHEAAKLSGDLLVLGNLPWVTNATVARLNGANLPTKQNFQGLRGIEARTGKSNFDVSEWMLIELVKALRGRPATLAMLCKTAIARKLLRFAWQNDGRIADARIYGIDAKAQFGAAVDACLLVVRTGQNGPMEAAVYPTFEAESPAKLIGLEGRDLVSDVRAYRELRHFDGRCECQWRSGVKHDCAPVMELHPVENNLLRNNLGEMIQVEPGFLYPLLKCTDLAHGRTEPGRYVLVTQSRVGEDTAGIELMAPKTWAYLKSHSVLFCARKSSIYSKQPPFSIFGIGEYSFAPWKVAISGLHKSPRFNLVQPFREKTVFFDDACYFLPFQNRAEAEVVAAILNSEASLSFLSALLFEDSKRPVTVDLLRRLNLRAIAADAGLSTDWRVAREESRREAALPVQREFQMGR